MISKKVISAKAVQSADLCAILNVKFQGCNTEILLAPSVECPRFSDLAWKLPSVIDHWIKLKSVYYPSNLPQPKGKQNAP
jgi:hypothetical protein